MIMFVRTTLKASRGLSFPPAPSERDFLEEDDTDIEKHEGRWKDNSIHVREVNVGGGRGDVKETGLTREERLAMTNNAGGFLERRGKLQEEREDGSMGSTEKAEPDMSNWALDLPEWKRNFKLGEH